MMGQITCITSGLYTTIQDKGRFGFSEFGVPKSGVMDQRSFFLANALLGNDKNCAALEWTMISPKLLFSARSIIVCTGAICDPFINGKQNKMNTRILIEKDDVLEFKNVKNGCWGYVGIYGGFTSEIVMSSRSFYKNVTKSSVLKKGNIVPYGVIESNVFNFSSVKVEAFWKKSDWIDVYPGAEYDQLLRNEKESLFNSKFTISNVRSRMGIQLKEGFSNVLPSMLTSPVLPGTVQLTPSGKIIVLMRDCQTTGGYPRILQLTKEAINFLAQKREGDCVRFRLVGF